MALKMAAWSGARGDQTVANIDDIDLRIGHGLPGMRIVVAAHFPWHDPLGRHRDQRFAARGLQQPRHPAFEAEAVDDHELGIGDLPGISRRRRVDMGIAVGPDQRRHVDIITADIAHNVGEDREARNDVDALRGARRSARQQQRQTNQAEQSPHRTHASRWRPGNSCRTRPLTLPNSSDTI
ncbi:hypothetical protein ABIF16_001451 [Bradyrhizobium elkanii]